MKLSVKPLLVVLSLMLLVGCASVQLSPQQRRSMQARTFSNAEYDNVFRAFKTVLQDEGYIIKNQDLSGGLIVANIQKTDRAGAFFAALGGAQNYRTGEGFELSVNLEKINVNTIETRMTLQKLESFSQGGNQGHEILDAQLYQAFYDKVKIEMERRKAMGKANS